MNLGNGYNATTSTFTAPVNGVYYISASAREYTTAAEISLFQVHFSDGIQERLGYAAASTPNTMSVASTLFLEKGDEVRVTLETFYDAHIFCHSGTPECFFHGYLIYSIV